jgi:hypothetical protein
MFFEVLSLTYHSFITEVSFTYPRSPLRGRPATTKARAYEAACSVIASRAHVGRADLIRAIEEYVAHNRHAGTPYLDCLRGDDRPKGASP